MRLFHNFYKHFTLFIERRTGLLIVRGKKSQIFRDKIAEKSANFAGIFEANLAGKQSVKKTADFVVIFRANFARNQLVLH